MSTGSWVKTRYPEWNPGKWNQRLKPAVPGWFNFDHTHVAPVLRSTFPCFGIRLWGPQPGTERQIVQRARGWEMTSGWRGVSAGVKAKSSRPVPFRLKRSSLWTLGMLFARPKPMCCPRPPGLPGPRDLQEARQGAAKTALPSPPGPSPASCSIPPSWSAATFPGYILLSTQP